MSENNLSTHDEKIRIYRTLPQHLAIRTINELIEIEETKVVLKSDENTYLGKSFAYLGIIQGKHSFAYLTSNGPRNNRWLPTIHLDQINSEELEVDNSGLYYWYQNETHKRIRYQFKEDIDTYYSLLKRIIDIQFIFEDRHNRRWSN